MGRAACTWPSDGSLGVLASQAASCFGRDGALPDAAPQMAVKAQRGWQHRVPLAAASCLGQVGRGGWGERRAPASSEA